MTSLDLIKIDSLLFDLGNVIYKLDIPLAEANIQVLLKPGITRDQVIEVIKKFEIGAISISIFINSILRLCPHTVQARDVIVAWNSMLIDLPIEHIQKLEKLKSSYQVYLLSNNNELHFEHMTSFLAKQYDITNFNELYFHNTFYSHLIQQRKPNANAFHFVVDKTGLNPSRTLFVDDSYDNIVAAQGLNFETLLFHPGSDFVSLAETLTKGK